MNFSIETVVKLILVFLIIGLVIYEGPIIARPLIDALTGANELSAQAKAQSQDSFDFFLKEYKDCKNSPDSNCLCSASLVLPENTVVEIKNDPDKKQTTFSLLKGKIRDSSGIFDLFAPPSYEGKYDSLASEKNEALSVSDDLASVAKLYWAVKTSGENAVLDYTPAFDIGVAYLGNTKNCAPCLVLPAYDAPSFRIQDFDPGYFYKADQTHLVLLSDNKKVGEVMNDRFLREVRNVNDLAKLKRCSLIDAKVKEQFDLLVTSFENCLPYVPLSQDFVSQEVRVKLGENQDVVGVKYFLSKYGIGSWQDLKYYKNEQRTVSAGARKEEVRTQNVFYQVTSPSESQVTAAKILLDLLKGKSAEQGLSILTQKGIISFQQEAGVPISTLVGIEANLKPRTFVEGQPCASFDVYKDQKYVLPEGYTIDVSARSFELLKEGVSVSSKELPLSLCQINSLAANPVGLTNTVSLNQDLVHLYFYPYPNHQICLYVKDKVAVEQETINAAKSMFTEK